MKIEITKELIQKHGNDCLLQCLKSKAPRKAEVFVGFVQCVIDGVTYKYPKRLRQWVARVMSGQKVKPIVCFIRENVG